MADGAAWALVAWFAISTNSAITQTFETRELCEVAGQAIFDKPAHRHWPERVPRIGGNYICVQRRWRAE